MHAAQVRPRPLALIALPIDAVDARSQHGRHLAPSARTFTRFLADYRARHPDDVLDIRRTRCPRDQDVTAVIWRLAARGPRADARFRARGGHRRSGRDQHLRFARRASRGCSARRRRGCTTPIRRARRRPARRASSSRARCSTRSQSERDRSRAACRCSSISRPTAHRTSRAAIIVAEHPDTGAGNLSYHRAMLAFADANSRPACIRADICGACSTWPRSAAIRCQSPWSSARIRCSCSRPRRGCLRRGRARGRGRPARARRSRWCARRATASRVPAARGISCWKASIDPAAQVEEGPFGEFTGYSSDRSTNNLFRVETMMRRSDAMARQTSPAATRPSTSTSAACRARPRWSRSSSSAFRASPRCTIRPRARIFTPMSR